MRSTNQSKVITDFIFTNAIGVDGTYVIVGHGGTSVYAEPILNRATGIADVSGGIVTSITVTNGGFGYSQLNPPEVIIKSDVYDIENILSIKVIGDHGKIIGINTFVTGTPGIGTTTPSYQLHVSGSVSNTSIYATHDIVAYSDASVKENIRPIENVIERIQQSRGVLYDRIDNNVKNNIGFIIHRSLQPKLYIFI